VDAVERFVTELLAAGKSRDTTVRIVNTLGYVLKHALKRGLIPHNPVSIADKPTTMRRTPELPTLAQVYALADAAPTREAGNLVLFAAFTGIRKSELFGLRWSSVNLTPGTESVRIIEQYYKGHVTDTKTAAGRREQVLGREAARVIREHSALQQIDQRPNPHGLVFPAPEGGYWEARNFQARYWNMMREAVELPSLMFHTLRYFFISHVRESSGLAASVTQQIVGHADDRQHTAYTRPTEGTEQLIRDGLATVFARPEQA
jgi:integrase